MKRDFFHTGLNTSRSDLLNVRTLVNEIREALMGNYLISLSGLAIGSNKDDVASIAFDYSIAGVKYSKAAITTGTAPGTVTVPQGLFGAVAFDIDSAGTITAVNATANATGYATAALAIAGLPTVGAGLVRMGYITASNSAAAFIFGTTLLDVATGTVTFVNGTTRANVIGAAVS